MRFRMEFMKQAAANPDYLIGAVTMLVFAAIGMYVATLIPTALRTPPVTYSVNWTEDVSSVCPGDTYNLGVQVEVHEESVLNVVNVILDAQTFAPVPPPQPFYDLRPRAYPHIASYEYPVTWVVPEVPPGDYIRVTAATAQYADSQPAFMELPFHVREDCP